MPISVAGALEPLALHDARADDVPALLEAACSRDEAKARRAREALVGLEEPQTAAARAAGNRSPEDPVLDALAEAARTGKTPVRIAALEVIAARGAIDAETTVVFLCEDKNERVALAAIAALADLINDGDSLQDALVLLNDVQDAERRAGLEASIVASIRRLGLKEGNAGDLVFAYRVASRPEMKASLARMVAALGDAALLEEFRRAEMTSTR